MKARHALIALAACLMACASASPPKAPLAAEDPPSSRELCRLALEYQKKGSPGRGGSLSNMRKAFDLYEKATERDATSAPAFLGLAEASTLLAYPVREGAERREVFPLAKAAAAKSVQLDPRFANAHLALAEIYFGYDFDWQKAEVEYRRAIDLDPAAVEARAAYGLFLGAMGRWEEAISAATHAERLAPLSPAPPLALTQIYLWAHRDDDAVTEGKRSVSLDPTASAPHLHLGLVYIDKHLGAEALRELEAAVALDGGGGGALAALAYARALGGDREGPREMMQKIEAVGSLARPVGYRMAAVSMALGDTDEAFRWLERDLRRRELLMTRLKVDPLLYPLRSDPRFADLLHRVGFDPVN